MPGEIHQRSSEPGLGGQCASIRASPLEPRIAPSSAQRPERAQHASDPPRFALARLQVAFGLHRSSAQVLKVWPSCVEAHVAPQGSAVGSRLDVCLRRGAQLDPHDANQQAAALCLPSASHFMPLWPVHVRVPCGVCSTKARFVFSPAGRSTRAVGRGMRRLAYTP